ncbi:NtaA/DmoA family FMN-dependent monooxygenase [Nakamurella leprariae]|uniref:NtaA/DmoA family FMN-dependent monooxygenase n=1 Tax=Nakamurella leprariae TaxID=2803911 RepID=A0A938YFR5_9ACTN|nr:NtaA/DmoA family FMN-dependent monooxygenase [Nakamurella leprariae]MBM9467000.1 NtaA/DmoA family FMN-dependent monooxygenase [Nakamurella leprariae]
MSLFHLGWFNGAGFSLNGWNAPGSGVGYEPWQPDQFQDAIRTLERGGFDFMILEDSSMVPEAFGGNPEFYLNRGIMAPKLDPVPLVPYLAMATKHIGIVPTLTTGFYHPWLLARLMTTLDHLTKGRIGWNIVTATTQLAWSNYGLQQPEHDMRYDLADEFVEITKQLWASFPASAAVFDAERNIAYTAKDVKPINYEGKFFSSRGPLNAPAGPQGTPVLFQAGGSPRGRQFAAKNVEVIIASCTSVEDMKDYYQDVKEHARSVGRDPDTVKVMFATGAILGNTDSEAQATADTRARHRAADLDGQLAGISNITGIDFSRIDIDAPMPELTTNGSQSSLREFLSTAKPGATLREVLASKTSPGIMGFPMIGTVKSVAGQMEEIMQEVGGDGFLFGAHIQPEYMASIVDRLIPELRRRGVVRTGYPHATFRENLQEF